MEKNIRVGSAMTAPASKKRTPCLSDPTLTTKVSMKNQAKKTQTIANLEIPSNAAAAEMIRATRPFCWLRAARHIHAVGLVHGGGLLLCAR
jgi:hypothetical protein